MSQVMTKPFYAISKQQRHRSACTSSESDQRVAFICSQVVQYLLILYPAEFFHDIAQMGI